MMMPLEEASVGEMVSFFFLSNAHTRVPILIKKLQVYNPVASSNPGVSKVDVFLRSNYGKLIDTCYRSLRNIYFFNIIQFTFTNVWVCEEV